MTEIGPGRGSAPGWLLDLDEVPLPYGDVWSLQHALLGARQQGNVPDTLILVEHRPVVTIGRSGNPAHLLVPGGALAARGVDFFEIERGGSATYHGPGQLVGYPILDLRSLHEDVGRFMRTLEQTVIDTLATFGITAGRDRGYPGVWVDGAKICAMGVAIKRRVTMHGFALNVTTDVTAFNLINPCGLDRPVTSMAIFLGRPVDLGAVRQAYARHFAEAFRIDLHPVTLKDIETALAGVRVQGNLTATVAG